MKRLRNAYVTQGQERMLIALQTEQIYPERRCETVNMMIHCISQEKENVL